MKDFYEVLKEITVELDDRIIGQINDYVNESKKLNISQENAWELFYKIIESPWINQNEYVEMKRIFVEKWM